MATKMDEWRQLALTHLVLGDVVDERFKQLKRWSYEHDDEHEMEDWLTFIDEYTNRAGLELGDTKKVRKRLVQIAALAVAALEVLQRKEVAKIRAAERRKAEAEAKKILAQRKKKKKRG